MTDILYKSSFILRVTLSVSTRVSHRSTTLLRGRDQTGEDAVHRVQQGGSTREPLQRSRGGDGGTAAHPAHQCGQSSSVFLTRRVRNQ